MRWTFHGFNQVLGLLISRSQFQVRGNWRYDESLFPLGIPARIQALANEAVHGGLEGFTRATDFVVHEPNYIVIESECRSHIMMLHIEAS